MIAWFAHNHVAANLLMAVILFSGLYSLSRNIPLEIFPRIELDIVVVNMVLPGATPEDVEQGISLRIEEAVQELEGIESIVSQSGEGFASVFIEIEPSYDVRELQEDIKAKVDAITTFPADAEAPVIHRATARNEVITVTISGPFSEREIREYGEKVRDDLLRIPGITQVALEAVRRYEIAVEVSQDRLREHGLTLQDIAQAVGQSSLDLSAGSLRTAGGDILIRSQGQAYHRDEFERIVIKTHPDGTILRLGDITAVRDGFDESPLRSRYNGQPAAMVEVYRVGEQSAITVADKVKAYIKRQQSQLPKDMALGYWDDDSQVVKNRISTLARSALQGGGLVLLLLALFLRPRVALWVFVGIPVSFMGAFLFMPVFDLTINIISLFAFILVLGIVVDDGIVTGENFYRRLEQGEDSLEAAISGTREVAVPVTFGILTTVAAFLPMALVEGGLATTISQIPLVVIPMLLFALVESKLVLPAHLKNIRLPPKGSKNIGFFNRVQQRVTRGFERFVERNYRPLLEYSLRRRYVVVSFFVGLLLLVLALVANGWTRFTFFPRIESETAVASLAMPAGTAFAVTSRHVYKMETEAEKLREKYRDPETGKSIVMNILTTAGSQRGGSVGTHLGSVRVELVPPEERSVEINSTEFVQEWREGVGEIPGAESIDYRSVVIDIGEPIAVRLLGSDLDILHQAALQVRQRLSTYPAVFDIADNLSDGKEELRVELRPEAHALGLSRRDIALQLRQAFYGYEVQRIQRGRDDIRVKVRFPPEERRSVADIEQMLITVPGERQVPLSHVATLHPGIGPALIRRVDRARTVDITADVDKKNVNMASLVADLDLWLTGILSQYPGVRYQFEGEISAQSETFLSLELGFLFTLFAIYCLLAVPLKSYVQPFIVMSVIPFGIVGAIGGHWLMGKDLSFMSVLGLLALVGVVVNDSLVLVDFINQRRSPEEPLNKTVVRAGMLRARPVMLTSLTTFIGLLPLLFEKSTQAQFLIPMAISLGFGILFATLVTLLLIPISYLAIEDMKSFWRRRPVSALPLST